MTGQEYRISLREAPEVCKASDGLVTSRLLDVGVEGMVLVFRVLMDRVAAATLTTLAKLEGRHVSEVVFDLVDVDEYSDRPGFEELKRMAGERRLIPWTKALERAIGDLSGEELPSGGSGTVRVKIYNTSTTEPDCEAAAALALMLVEEGVEELARRIIERGREQGVL